MDHDKKITRLGILQDKWYLVSPVFAITFIVTTNSIASRFAPKRTLPLTVGAIFLSALGEACLCTSVLKGEKK